MPAAPLIFNVGEQIGPYRLVKHLGSGAFGEVWQAARDAGLEVKVNVALKLQDSQRFPLEQIKREVRVWSWVSDHPHILPFIGAKEYLVRGVKYVGIASQYVAGGSLTDWLKRQPGGVADWPTACRIVCGILDGLAYMHDWRDLDTHQPAPIVHRDLKTANVLMNGDMPLLADLGLANIIEGSKDYRLSSHLSGTLTYMPPEALDGRVSPRMDIWAAGVILYKLLTGRVPFAANSSIALMAAIARNPVPPLPVKVPDGVWQVLVRALQKEEGQRYQTAAAMRQDLAQVMAGYAIPDPEATLYDYEGQQRDLEQRLAEEAEKRRQAEAEAARLRAQFAAHQQSEGEKQREAERLRRQAEEQERQRRATEAAKLERQRQEQQQREAERLRVAEEERKKQQQRQAQGFATTPAKSLWLKVVGVSAAALLSVGLLGYKLCGGATSPADGASSANDARPATLKAQDYTENLRNGIKLEMVTIPAGKFTMGSPANEEGRSNDEGPQHDVTISKPFQMGKYEVTQEQWQAVMGNNPSHFQNCPKCPVENVSWDDAQQFIQKLNGRSSRGKYRLPTEAEWEYAARAGSTGPYSGPLDEVTWYSANSGSKTHPVGEKKANAFGLYDMHGNVWEWCQDWYGPYSSNAVTDPSGPSTGSLRVLRGGGWDFIAAHARAAYRYYFAPGNRYSNLGFRLSRTPV